MCENIQPLSGDENEVAGTLLVTVPSMVGVDYDAHLLESITRCLAPATGWVPPGQRAEPPRSVAQVEAQVEYRRAVRQRSHGEVVHARRRDLARPGKVQPAARLQPDPGRASEPHGRRGVGE